VKQHKNDRSKNGLKNSPQVFSPCSVEEFKFATDALLPWTTILLLLND